MRFRPLIASSQTSVQTPPQPTQPAAPSTGSSYLPMMPDSYLPMKGYRKLDDSLASVNDTLVELEPGVNTLNKP